MVRGSHHRRVAGSPDRRSVPPVVHEERWRFAAFGYGEDQALSPRRELRTLDVDPAADEHTHDIAMLFVGPKLGHPLESVRAFPAQAATMWAAMGQKEFAEHMKRARIAAAAHKDFSKILDEFLALGLAVQQDSSLGPMWSKKHDDLVVAEAKAVAEHRRAYAGPTPAAALMKACELAGLEGPTAPDPDHDEFWVADMMSTTEDAPPERRKLLKGLLEQAVRFARSDRLFSAAFVLEKFDGIRSLP
jgi:hypothetical protein